MLSTVEDLVAVDLVIVEDLPGSGSSDYRSRRLTYSSAPWGGEWGGPWDLFFCTLGPFFRCESFGTQGIVYIYIYVNKQGVVYIYIYSLYIVCRYVNNISL